MRSGGEVDRRSFLVGASAAGSGLALGLAIPLSRAGMRAAEDPCDINCWVSIAPDDTVTIRTAHAEMGQGAMTALAMLVAEELECDGARAGTSFVSPGENLRRNRIWGDMSTGPSRSVASSQLYLRRAGATAREMLIAAAALRWNVPASQCGAQNSVITHAASGRNVTFGAVADGAAKIEPPAIVALKDPRDWKLAGTPRRRLDLPDKITGQPVFAIDVRLPDMLYAAVIHCPVFGGTLTAVDENSIAGMKGVRRIGRMPDGVAVGAEFWWQAKRASEALRIAWDDRGNRSLSSATIEKVVREGLDAPS